MKKYYTYLIFVLFIALSFTSCIDNNDDAYEEYLKQLAEYQKQVSEQFIADSIIITDYLTTNDSVATYHEESGIYYNIISEGGDSYPNSTSIIAVKYKGMLLDGTVFDETEDDETVSFDLSGLISGWRIGIPLIGSGGKIILYLPSYYAYGSNESDNIPANSVLIFDVELVSFY